MSQHIYFVLNVCHSASTSAVFSAGINPIITKMNSSQNVETMPKFYFEVRHPLWLLSEMAKKICLENLIFRLCISVQLIKLLAILTFRHVLMLLK